ncbi:MAG: leucine-rich repeat domain-containing protein, partial [Candidatus Gallimonas sp.]
PESVRSVGARAFKDCASLQTVTFVGTPKVETIGEEAFSGTAIASVELPASVKEVGARAFHGCASLRTATLPAVEKLGAAAFLESGITSVTFGDDAKTTGEGTFYGTPLQRVTLGTGIGEIGEAAFAECSSLTSIDLCNVEKVGTMAFSGCTELSVSGLNGVREFGYGAFYRCHAINSLDLSAAQTVGDYAFALDSAQEGGYTSVGFGDSLREIGIGAFFGGKESAITLPASTERIGYGAFTKSENLTEISVAAENERYFSEDGVLYRAVSENEYELIAYPVARVAADDKTYRIKEGTLTIAANAFAYVPATSVRTVVLPYSVLSIGDGAFYACNASEYRFESIQAPVLQTALREPAISGFFSLSYCNFKDELIGHTPIMTAPASSTVSILYPTNGVGYDNYVYRYYFGAKTKIGVLMNDTTRALKTAIEGFCSVDEVSSWNTLPVTEENKNEIRAFSEAVKTAHMNYEKIGKEAYSAEQLAFLGEENAEKLFAVEAALKSVKQRFGIVVTPATLTIAADSAHKSVYRSGERFSMEGLKLIVTYDDYSSEEADLSLVSVATGYDGALSELYSDVVLVGYGGLEVRVPITVTGENAAGEEETEDGGFNPVWVIVPVCAAAALAVGAVVTVVVIKKRKTAKYGASETESQPTDGADHNPTDGVTDDASETESQPTDGADNPTDGATDQESQPAPEAVNQTEEDETRHE